MPLRASIDDFSHDKLNKLVQASPLSAAVAQHQREFRCSRFSLTAAIQLDLRGRSTESMGVQDEPRLHVLYSILDDAAGVACEIELQVWKCCGCLVEVERSSTCGCQKRIAAAKP
jgi:hypothetical protein